MKKLGKYLKGYGKESVLGPTLKLAEATLELIVPLIIAGVVDRGIGGSNRTYTVLMCLLLVGLGLVGLFFSVLAQFFCAKASVGFVTALRSSLYKKLGTLSYSDIDTLGTSTMITRMTADTSKVQTGLNLALRLLLRSPFVVFGAAIMAFTVDAHSALTFVFAIPVLAVIIFGIMLITMPMYKNVQKGTDKILRRTRENLTGVRVIRAFRKEEDERAAFSAENTALKDVQMRSARFSALLNPLTYIVINFAILWLIEIGAVEVSHGNLTSGEVLALYNYMSQILIELIKLANLIISISRALASAKRIEEVFDLVSSENMGDAVDTDFNAPAVEFKNVSLSYAGGGASLSGISFTAERGKTVGIIGGTGSGKTTLINLIPAFYKATEGEVLVGGRNVNEYSPSALRSKIGIATQNAMLFAGTIRDNMLWGKGDATDGEIMSAIRIAQAENILSEGEGLDKRIEQEARNLSGGQKQRLSIARALVGCPEIIILDDATSALDFATDARLRTELRAFEGKSTLFIVSQRASSIMHADKILVLDEGELVGIGTHEELLSDCEVYREIYLSQYRKERDKDE